MIIGVPRERKILENRVALTPNGAKTLVQSGHRVLIETQAGAGSHFPDSDYAACGCEIIHSLAEVWGQANLIVKVKEPHTEEFKYFRKDLAIFDYLHLASMPEIAFKLRDSGMSSIAYELIRDEKGSLPLLEPMSEIAGKLSVLNGAYFLLTQNGGRGVLLGRAAGLSPARVTVIGAGVAGKAAVETALGLGASVCVLDVNEAKLKALSASFDDYVDVKLSTPMAIQQELPNTDLLVAAVLVPGAAAPRILTREMIRTMKPASVFVDISIDQGGCAETIRATDLQNPTYIEEGVIHYGVCNMPSQTARTSTLALTKVTLPYILEIANSGVDHVIRSNSIVRAAVNTHQGQLTCKAVAESIGAEYTEL
jgi:alanine dehydrogenase